MEDKLFALMALSALTGLLGLSIKKEAPQMALVLSLAATVLLFWSAIQALTPSLRELTSVVRGAGLESELVSPVLKLAGLSVLSRLGKEICLDAGERALASGVEIVAAAASLAVALPVFASVFSSLTRMLP